jgi:hypothetical protein
MLGSAMPLMSPVSAAWNTVARFDDYESARCAVDRLCDDGFPVEKPGTAGSGLRLVARVTCRATSYDLIARQGWAGRARSMLSEAGLLPQADMETPVR